MKFTREEFFGLVELANELIFGNDINECEFEFDRVCLGRDSSLELVENSRDYTVVSMSEIPVLADKTALKFALDGKQRPEMLHEIFKHLDDGYNVVIEYDPEIVAGCFRWIKLLDALYGMFITYLADTGRYLTAADTDMTFFNRAVVKKHQRLYDAGALMFVNKNKSDVEDRLMERKLKGQEAIQSFSEIYNFLKNKRMFRAAFARSGFDDYTPSLFMSYYEPLLTAELYHSYSYYDSNHNWFPMNTYAIGLVRLKSILYTHFDIKVAKKIKLTEENQVDATSMALNMQNRLAKATRLLEGLFNDPDEVWRRIINDELVVDMDSLKERKAYEV